jgi:hypothetical protein
MSQFFVVENAGNLPPQVATSYVTNSGSAIPVANVLNVLGSTVAAGSNPFRSIGSGNTINYQVQISQAIAATDITKIGLAAFDSARFTVDANGFVTLNSTGAGETITGDDGNILSPTGGNWNILGRSGSKTSGTASTLTIKSPPYADVGVSAVSTLNSGTFATANITLTLPASAGLADGDLFEYVCITGSALTIQAVGTQRIYMGSLVSSVAGTIKSTSIGDSVSLRYRATDGFLYATSIIGTWVIA